MARRRRKPDRRLELAAEGRVCGVDEVGYSPLAGPVVAAAVVLPRNRRSGRLAGLRDSKQLSTGQRERFYPVIRDLADVGVGSASVAEIDARNVYQANLLAMRRAVDNLQVRPDVALIDGRARPDLHCPVQAVIRGDEQCLSIAAASIIAKVTRDRIMHGLAEAHPVYGWQTNVGYGTDAHYLGLLRHGPSPHHRRTFAPVRTWFDEYGRSLVRLRFEPVSGLDDEGSIEVVGLRRDLYAVLACGRAHVGVIKYVRGRWRLRAVGYSAAGDCLPGGGPLSPWHDHCVESPCTDDVNALVHQPTASS